MGSFDSNERMRTVKAYNLHLVSESQCGLSGVPSLEDQDIQEPKKLIGFNYAKTMIDEEKSQSCCHFFLDDYQFERVWTSPEKYFGMLRGFQSVCTPDFSLYGDMPIPMQRWNIYRSRAVGFMWQREGIKVVPTLSWSFPESYAFCFDGLPKGATYAVSTIGVMRDKFAYRHWCRGMDEAIKRLLPKRLIVYGKMPDFDFGGVQVSSFNGDMTERIEKWVEGVAVRQQEVTRKHLHQN